MTLPNADSDLLIILASSRVDPLASVFSTFSEPAKSQQKLKKLRLKDPLLKKPK
jgi:hypothetical protein